jgi:drug/metabolite transporter (DMT)-like permease
MALFDGSPNWVPQSQDFWIGVLFAGLPATAYMYAVQNIAQRHLSEEKVALTYLFEPLFATLTGSSC